MVGAVPAAPLPEAVVVSGPLSGTLAVGNVRLAVEVCPKTL